MRIERAKQSVYLAEDIRDELHREAERLDRSLSWLLTTAWRIARENIRKIPSIYDNE